MKKQQLKKKVLKGLGIFLFLGMMVGCGSDDGPTPNPGPPTGGDISIAVGTFKGSITVYPPDNSPSAEYFDAEVTVTKVSNNQLKVTAKAGEPYSIVTPKTFNVNYSSAGMNDLQGVTAVPGSPEGLFLYNNQNKSLNMITEKQSATEVTFSFEGTKQ